MAEQRSEAEAQKTKELAKQIQQEREQEELEKISGKKGPKLDRGIDWMYQGTTGELAKEDAERKAEEFLLGKEYVPEGATHGDFDNGDQDQGINSILNKQEEPVKAASTVLDLEPSVKDRNEDFRLRVEDPMFFVSQKQREKVIQHDKTKALYERVVGYEEDEHRVKTKSARETTTTNERKRQKKHKKSKSRKRDRDNDHDSDSRSSDDNSAHRHRRRSRDNGLSRSKRYKRSSSNDRDVAHGSHDDRDSRKDRGEQRYREDTRSSRQRRYESDSDNDGKDSKANSRRHDNHPRNECGNRDHDRRRRDDERYRDDHHRHSHQSYDKHDRRPYSSKSPSPNRHEKKKEGYGLKGASVTVDPNDLGPSRDLLQKKRDEREAERRKIRESASTRRPRTEAERARALEEMQANARKREETRSSGDKKLYDDDEDGEPRASKGHAGFIKDVTRQSYGIDGEGGPSLSSRVAQNRHTNQRMSDSFL